MKFFEWLKGLFKKNQSEASENLEESLDVVIATPDEQEPGYLSEGQVSLLVEEMFDRHELTREEAIKATDPRSRTEELQKKIQDFFESKAWLTRLPNEWKPSPNRDITYEGPVVLEQHPYGTEIIGYHFGRYPRLDSKDRLKGSKAVQQSQKKSNERIDHKLMGPSEKERLLSKKEQYESMIADIEEQLKGLDE